MGCMKFGNIAFGQRSQCCPEWADKGLAQFRALPLFFGYEPIAYQSVSGLKDHALQQDSVTQPQKYAINMRPSQGMRGVYGQFQLLNALLQQAKVSCVVALFALALTENWVQHLPMVLMVATCPEGSLAYSPQTGGFH